MGRCYLCREGRILAKESRCEGPEAEGIWLIREPQSRPASWNADSKEKGGAT